MVEVARAAHPQFKYYEAFPEDFVPPEKFDYILLCDVGDIADVQKTLLRLQTACERHTRLIIYSYNDLWEPLIASGSVAAPENPPNRTELAFRTGPDRPAHFERIRVAQDLSYSTDSRNTFLCFLPS